MAGIIDIITGSSAKRARRDSEKQQAEARRQTQIANEEAGREQQRGERGAAVPAARRGRNILAGSLGARLRQSLGG